MCIIPWRNLSKLGVDYAMQNKDFPAMNTLARCADLQELINNPYC